MPDVKISPATMVIGLAGVLVLGVFGWLTFSPAPPPPPSDDAEPIDDVPF